MIVNTVSVASVLRQALLLRQTLRKRKRNENCKLSHLVNWVDRVWLAGMD